jgi:hypothetical protein
VPNDRLTRVGDEAPLPIGVTHASPAAPWCRPGHISVRPYLTARSPLQPTGGRPRVSGSLVSLQA